MSFNNTQVPKYPSYAHACTADLQHGKRMHAQGFTNPENTHVQADRWSIYTRRNQRSTKAAAEPPSAYSSLSHATQQLPNGRRVPQNGSLPLRDPTHGSHNEIKHFTKTKFETALEQMCKAYDCCSSQRLPESVQPPSFPPIWNKADPSFPPRVNEADQRRAFKALKGKESPMVSTNLFVLKFIKSIPID
jgi:hypothetical protein